MTKKTRTWHKKPNAEAFQRKVIKEMYRDMGRYWRKHASRKEPMWFEFEICCREEYEAVLNAFANRPAKYRDAVMAIDTSNPCGDNPPTWVFKCCW